MSAGWSDHLVVRPLTVDDAREVVGWQYGGPWQIYNLTGDDELPSAVDGYRAVADASNGRLVGFFCTGPEARVPGIAADPGIIDLGVGMDPRWVGKGHGKQFGSAVLIELRLPSPPVGWWAGPPTFSSRPRRRRSSARPRGMWVRLRRNPFHRASASDQDRRNRGWPN